jgi:hypothetical protein
LWHHIKSTEELHVIKDIAEEDRKFWRVIKHSESDKVSFSEDRGFQEFDALAEVVEEPRSLCQLSTLSAVISLLSNSELRGWSMSEVSLDSS